MTEPPTAPVGRATARLASGPAASASTVVAGELRTAADDGAAPQVIASRLEDLARTGDDAVDAVLAALQHLGQDTPLDQHVAVLGEVHDALQRRLRATQG